MPYGDELTISERIEKQREKAHSINNKVIIGGTEYTFERREFGYGFSMIVPESFKVMPTEVAEQKFPYRDSPKIIISSDDFRLCIAFNTARSENGGINERVSSFRSYVKRIQPANVFFTKGVHILQNGLQVGYYDYRYPVVDNDLYNLTFVTDLSEMELMGWFICPVDVKDKWNPLIHQMIQTIELVKEENNNE